MNKRLISLASTMIFIFTFLCYRVYKVQENMKLRDENTNNQKEIISDVKIDLLDSENKSLLNYEEEYYVSLDRKPFKLNDPTINLDNLLTFNYIMKSENNNFSLGKLFNGKDKEYIKISKGIYEKLKELDELKGVYTFKKYVQKSQEAWKIENILSNYYIDNDDNKKVLKDLGTLERKIYSYSENNKKLIEEFELGRDAVYTSKNNTSSFNNINVKTTLNSEWQKAVREVLKDSKYNELKNIGVVIVEGDTGKVKCLAQKDESQPNIILGGTYGYEPGSIFKILTEELILEKGITKQNESFLCEGKYCSRQGKPYAHGLINIEKAMKVSCNEFFQKAGLQIGYNDLYNFAKNQGVFSKILNIDSERIGEADKNGGVTNLAIGQSIITTPIQMVGTISSIVNNGVYTKPYIIDSLIDKNGNTVKVFKSEDIKKVINKNTSLKVKKDMKTVVDDGSGYQAKINGIDIGGKTGTANGISDDYGSFLGYFNYQDKYYSMIVFVPGISGKNKNGEEMVGGNTAAPIFRDIILSLLKK